MLRITLGLLLPSQLVYTTNECESAGRRNEFVINSWYSDRASPAGGFNS